MQKETRILAENNGVKMIFRITLFMQVSLCGPREF